MNKKLFSALLCGVVMFSAGSFTSCYDDSELNSKMRALEVMMGNLEDQLGLALKTGVSITDLVPQKDGSWLMTFSKEVGGQKTLTVGGGGSDVSVEVKDGVVIIKVGEKEYEIPMGAAVNSLTYCPEYADGTVKLGNAGATIKLLATPAVSADALAKATFDIAGAYELKTRASNNLFETTGTPTIDGDFINVNIKGGDDVVAGKTYNVSIMMTIGGASIGSDLFTVEVAEDYTGVQENIGGTELSSDYSPVALESDFYQITVNGLDLLGAFNFKDFFTTIPANAEFQVASATGQPNNDAKSKAAMLRSSLKADGSWAFSERPGTAFNVTEGQSGFRFNVLLDGAIIAKTYVVINDPIAAVDFTALFSAQAESEYGGRVNNNADGHLPVGASTFDFQKSLYSYSETGEQNDVDWVIIHSGRAELYGNWANYMLGDIIYNDGETGLVLGETGEKYAVLGSRGIYWFLKGFTITVPDSMPAYIDDNGVERKPGNTLLDKWGPQGVDYKGAVTTMDEALPYVSIDPATGVLSFTEKYTGFCTRLAIGACYEYAYGVKKIGKADQLGLFFFNRRQNPEGATVPTL